MTRRREETLEVVADTLGLSFSPDTGKRSAAPGKKCKSEMRPDGTRTCHTMMQMPMSPGMDGDRDIDAARCGAADTVESRTLNVFRFSGHSRLLDLLKLLQKWSPPSAEQPPSPPLPKTPFLSAPTLRCAHPTWLTCHKCGPALCQYIETVPYCSTHCLPGTFRRPHFRTAIRTRMGTEIKHQDRTARSRLGTAWAERGAQGG